MARTAPRVRETTAIATLNRQRHLTPSGCYRLQTSEFFGCRYIRYCICTCSTDCECSRVLRGARRNDEKVHRGRYEADDNDHYTRR